MLLLSIYGSSLFKITAVTPGPRTMHSLDLCACGNNVHNWTFLLVLLKMSNCESSAKNVSVDQKAINRHVVIVRPF